jgi:hypothetical protein
VVEIRSLSYNNFLHRPHRLKSFEERWEGFIVLAPNGFEVPWLRRFIGERLEVRDKPATEVALVVDVVSR